MNKTSIRQVLQVLYYIQSNAPKGAKKYDLMYLLKMVFFAVRHHLRHFGTPFMNVHFYAMQKGPVASEVKDIIEHKLPANVNSAEISLLDEIEPISDYYYKIKEQGIDELSPSFINSLNFAIEHFGKEAPFTLSDFSHDFPEWKKFKNTLKTKNRVLMNYADFFDDPEQLVYLKADPYVDDKEFLSSLKEDYILQNADTLPR